uniref:Zic4 protein n=1 Tax=Mus musculus TaxID=10090 RepID=Q08EF0_MOUSE|nr:Zic4 protein [Mus musculus]
MAWLSMLSAQCPGRPPGGETPPPPRGICRTVDSRFAAQLSGRWNEV